MVRKSEPALDQIRAGHLASGALILLSIATEALGEARELTDNLADAQRFDQAQTYALQGTIELFGDLDGTIAPGARNAAMDIQSNEAEPILTMVIHAREMSMCYLAYREKPTQVNHAAWKDATARFEGTYRNIVGGPIPGIIGLTEDRMMAMRHVG